MCVCVGGVLLLSWHTLGPKVPTDAVVPLSEECFRDLDESVSQIKTFKKTQKCPIWCLKAVTNKVSS